MNKFLFILMLIALFTTDTLAQKEANIWYFGHNAGLDFNGGAPVPLTDGALDTDEGCATISNSDGELLFYTDGKLVWNRNHQPMPNGFGLLGDKSSTQSGVIIPQPGSNTLYNVFTVDLTANAGGISYSQVNMDLDDGMGDVTGIKNVQLLTPACEKITAVLHENERDIWVIGHAWESSNFMAWLITENGVNTNPVISTTGSFVGGDDFNTIGYLKASAEGDKIAAAHWHNLNVVEFFDFDNATGILSNPIQLSGYAGSGCYGVEFAASAPILYVSERTYGGSLYQYDISSGDAATIEASRITLATYIGRWGALQLGPDGKMYVSKRNSAYLGVINNPDELGVGCDYVDLGLHLDGQLSWIGLPSFIQSYFVLADFSFEGWCPSLPTAFTFEGSDSAMDSVRWNFGDPASGAANISYALNPTHTFNDAGTYEVSLIVYSGELTDTSIQEVTVEFPDFELGPDITSCANVLNTLDATTANASYLWSTGATQAMIEVADDGMYWVEAVIDGCPVLDTLNVIHLPLPEVDLQNDPVICEDETFTFDGTTPNAASYLWQNNSTEATLTSANPGNYAVTVTGVNGCSNSDASFLNVNPLPVFSLGADALVCEGENYLLDAGLGNNSTYLWQNGSTNSTFNVSEAGIYEVAVTTDGCTSVDEVQVEYTSIPQVNLGNDTLICQGDEITLDVFYDEYTNYTWQDNSSLSTFTIDQPGIFSVQLENMCGVVSDEINIEDNVPPLPRFIGNDTTICEGDRYIIDATNANTTDYLWNDGSTEPTIAVEEPGYYSVTWANRCGYVTEVVEVESRRCECPVILPNAFSPNGDGYNDNFNTVSPCLFTSFNLKIFSRWGELVFETDDPSMTAGWNGKIRGKSAQIGVYVFVVEFAHEFDEGMVSGDVTITR